MEENNNDVVIEAPIQQLVNQDSNQELEDVQTEQQAQLAQGWPDDEDILIDEEEEP